MGVRHALAVRVAGPDLQRRRGSEADIEAAER
jgi:hypothetical protein